MSTRPNLPVVIEKLEKFHGTPRPPQVTKPLELILWENVVYLADDKKRQIAFDALRDWIGLSPANILAASEDALLEVTKLAGIVPKTQVEKLKRIAQIVQEEFQGDLDQATKQPLLKAKRALKKFPAIGDPGAERILLFSRAYPLFPLESNGLRVMLRVGFGKEDKNYSTSYRSVQEAVKTQLSEDYSWLIKAHQLLRFHGQEVCQRTQPDCHICPMTGICRYYKESRLAVAN